MPEAHTFRPHLKDTLAERLRRRPAKPMGSPRVGSNPTGVASCHRSTCVQCISHMSGLIGHGHGGKRSSKACPYERHSNDTLAEQLRRRPAKPMGSPRVGSNPTGVVCPIKQKTLVLRTCIVDRCSYTHGSMSGNMHNKGPGKQQHETYEGWHIAIPHGVMGMWRGIGIICR